MIRVPAARRRLAWAALVPHRLAALTGTRVLCLLDDAGNLADRGGGPPLAGGGDRLVDRARAGNGRGRVPGAADFRARFRLAADLRPTRPALGRSRLEAGQASGAHRRSGAWRSRRSRRWRASRPARRSTWGRWSGRSPTDRAPARSTSPGRRPRRRARASWRGTGSSCSPAPSPTGAPGRPLSRS